MNELLEMIEKVLDEMVVEEDTSRLKVLVELIEYTALLAAIKKLEGNRTAIAEYLGVDRNTVRSKLLRFELYEHCVGESIKAVFDNNK